MRLRLGSVRKRWDSKYSLHLFRSSLASTLRPIFTFHVRKNTSYCNYCVNLHLLNPNFGIRAVEEAHGLVAIRGFWTKISWIVFGLILILATTTTTKSRLVSLKPRFWAQKTQNRIYSHRKLCFWVSLRSLLFTLIPALLFEIVKMSIWVTCLHHS